MFKRFFLFCIVTAGISMLVSCNSTGVSSQVEQSFVFVSHYWGNEKEGEILDKTVEGFEKINQAVVFLEPENHVAKNFKVQAQVGLGADVVIGVPYDQIIPLAKAGLLRPLDAYEASIDRESYQPEHLEALTYNGKLYALPFMATTSMLFYNKDKLKDPDDPAKVKEPPSTLSELLDEANAGNGVAMAANFQDAYWGIGAFGGTILDTNGELQLTPKSYEAWFRWLKTAQSQPGVVINFDDELLIEKFIQGEVTYLVSTIDRLKYFEERMGEGEENIVGVASLPNGPGEAEIKQSTPASITKNDTTENGDSVDEAPAPLTGRASPLFYLQAIAFNKAANEKTVETGLRQAQFLNHPTLQRKLILDNVGRAPSNFRFFIKPDLSQTGHALVNQSRTSVTVPLDKLEQFNTLSLAADTIYLDLLQGGLNSKDAANKLVDLLKQTF